MPGWQPGTAPKPTGAAAISGLLPAPWRAWCRGPNTGPRRVLFVCTRNSARSQLAAALWQQVSEIPRRRRERTPRTASPKALSTSPAVTAWTLRTSPRARWIQVAEEGDFIVTVCDNAHEELPGLGGIHWSVPDPLRLGTKEAFDMAFNDIARRINDLAPRVAAV